MPKYRIAGHIVAMEYQSPDAQSALGEYLYDGPEAPERVFAVTPDALEAAEREWLKTYRSEIEEFLLSRQFCAWLSAHDGMYLHASCVAYRGYAYVFTADSGAGKSTHARLWRQAFGDACVIVNDDKPFLVRKGGLFYVSGSPWCGKERMRAKAEYPLGGVCLIGQASENAIEPLPPEDAVTTLLRQTRLPEDEADMEKLCDFIDALVTTVPLYRLCCTISEDAARVAYETMRKDREA